MTNKVLNINDCWIKVKEVARLKKVTSRAIRLAIQKDKYISKITQTPKEFINNLIKVYNINCIWLFKDIGEFLTIVQIFTSRTLIPIMII